MIEKTLPHEHGHISPDLRYEMSDTHTFDVVSELFKILGDEKRIRLFWLLCHCEECVINISVLLDMSSPALSHHLKLLKNAGLIISRRVGKEVYYTAAKTARAEALHNAIEGIIEVACPSEEAFRESAAYDSQIQIATEVHRFLTENLATRYTIEALSARFPINQTTLKTTFKRVYGKPIATYMKEFRIKRAMELLSQGDPPISEIAETVGYENQSKFAVAFKDVTGILPKDYRKKRQET